MVRLSNDSLAWIVSVLVTCGLGVARAADGKVVDHTPDMLERMVEADARTLRLTLPDGQPVVGTVVRMERSNERVTLLAGTIQHPEPGEFSFTCTTSADGAPTPSGTLRLTSQPVEWSLEPAATAGRFHLVKKPAADAFRPRNQTMPTNAPPGKSPAELRAEAEAALRKGLNIEQTSADTLRVGAVEIRRSSRSVRIPAVVNQREGTVEYLLVTPSGKKHESVFTTTASPRDAHLALLLLGVKPAPLPRADAAELKVPADAAVSLTVEWTERGATVTRPLARCFTATTHRPGVTPAPVSDGPWHYNGSRFNAAGFAALTEGSIISLIRDDFALANNPAPDRADDDIHLPDPAALPPLGTPVTIVFTVAAPSKSTP